MSDPTAEAVAAHDRAMATRAHANTVTAELCAAVRAALAAGVPAIDLAAALGVTRGRVYQLRG